MKLTLDFAASRIGLEGEGDELLTVIEAARKLVPSLTHIEIHTTVARSAVPDKTPQKTAENPPHSGSGAGNGNTPTGRTLRQFVRTFKLDNMAERITAIAYYKKAHENIESFAPKDMAEWFTNCGLPKPKLMPSAIFNAAKSYGYVSSGGHGKWRITTNGENLIVSKENDMADTAA